MGGERADMSATDPPYAVFGSSTGIGKNLQDDNMILPFCREVYSSICAVTPTNAHAYVCCDWKSFNAWWSQVGRFDLRVLNCIVWDKGDGGIGTNYTSRHEFILFFNREAAQQKMTERRGGMRLVHGIANVQRFNIAQGDDRQHNAAKPVPLFEVFIGASSDKGGIVYEPFSGSGTTIIAAENLARQCRAVEISPAYVAVALQRYQDAFGITPELVTDLIST
jgi:DNA modification methylase